MRFSLSRVFWLHSLSHLIKNYTLGKPIGAINGAGLPIEQKPHFLCIATMNHIRPLDNIVFSIGLDILVKKSKHNLVVMPESKEQSIYHYLLREYNPIGAPNVELVAYLLSRERVEQPLRPAQLSSVRRIAG